MKCNALGECKDQNGKNARGINFIDINGSYGSWTIQGRTWCLWSNPLHRDECDDPNTYIIPYPGTGTAGSTCDPLGAYPDVNHSCNWGKIGYGETVAIPLYRAIGEGDQDESYDMNDDFILDPDELGLSSLKIKIRTPCKDRSNTCEDNERYRLYIEGNPNMSDTMMIWEITGTCVLDNNTEKKCYLGQIDERDKISGRGKEKTQNSEIYADLINNGTINNDYVVVDGMYEYGDDNFKFRNILIKFLQNRWWDGSYSEDSQVSEADTAWRWDMRSLTKPVLNLSVIQTMIDEDDTSKTIPYLEYQIETTAQAPGADVYQTIIGEGYSGNFKQSVEMKRGYETGVLKFVIQN